jgi:DNA polymerase-4
MDARATCLCRDCGRLDISMPPVDVPCPGCGSTRLVRHPELGALAIAHVDCDAYYASIEKRDRPELADLPLIVGGGDRGVVTTACYIARRSGVKSAMPMAWARKLCPEAVILRPDMEKYARESRRIAELMRGVTPVVEQVSIDEAYMDLGHGERDEPAARSLARLALLIEKRIGITVSIGLAPNKLLAKLASDLGKPRGFAVIGRGDALDVIGPMKATALPGIGPAMGKRLEALDIHLVSDLRAVKPDDLVHRFGVWARRMIDYAHAEDARIVRGTRRTAVSIAAETTFDKDLRELAEIDAILERLCGTLSRRLDKAGLAAASLTLKLRRAADRRIITRACPIHRPTQRAETIWQAARRVLATELDGIAAFRLVGVTAGHLLPGTQADPPDLFSGLGA